MIALKKRTRTRRFVRFLVVLSISVVAGLYLLEVDFYRIRPTQHDEYHRPGVDQAVLDLCQNKVAPIPAMMKKYAIPGVSVALVDRQGLLWAASYGYTNCKQDVPVTRDTSFLICSMSKTFAALTVMCAVRDGLVGLDVPITNYLPGFTINSRFEVDPQNKITLRHLLNHTSGLSHVAPIGNSKQPSYGSLAEHANSIRNTWLRFPVGAEYSYSGAGYDLATYIIEVRLEQPFADYLEENVLIPLRMPRTTVDKGTIEARTNQAVGRYPHMNKLALASDVPWVGAGGVYSCANDLAKLIQFFLNWGVVEGQSLLGEEDILAMYTPSTHQNYGLGVSIGEMAVWHAGKGLGFESIMAWSPEYGIGCVVLTNTEGYDDRASWHLDWTRDMLRTMIDSGLVDKIEHKRPSRIDRNTDGADRYQPPDPDTFTPYQASWEKYVGSYDYVLRSYELRNYARIAVTFGYPTGGPEVKQIDGYLCIDGIRLDEYRPGLFFTALGDCLDFTGRSPRWNNHELNK